MLKEVYKRQDKDIQYHWSTDSDPEMFDSPDGPKNEVINSGGSVLFIPIAEIDYIQPDKPVSSTHLDVYKRQHLRYTEICTNDKFKKILKMRKK